MHQAASIDIPTADGGFSPNPLFRQLASSGVKFLPDGPSSAVEYAHNAALPGTLSQQQVVKLQQLREETALDASSRHEVEECMDALGVPKEARDFAEIYGVLDAMDKAAVMHAARVPPEKDLWDFLHQHTGPGRGSRTSTIGSNSAWGCIIRPMTMAQSKQHNTTQQTGRLLDELGGVLLDELVREVLRVLLVLADGLSGQGRQQRREGAEDDFASCREGLFENKAESRAAISKAPTADFEGRRAHDSP
ncbi:unnamed protein product [Vitrella brassicaformis CCMP3155]|uniref:Uncharacterized protein n=1 Tax=Vitrella brassicaformis (strain CCMP3155) TaxID=1169540 RepID=A0A0G4F4X5_VITBC|nr:unnamed protein product [Vitrella brassicaformis CCMP3155]|eukprot:CEM06772.1 unnamed protein product [Vitrella brassicaformis CCMP3155]